MSLSKIPIQTRRQRERNACSKEKKRVTIIFHNKTKLTQEAYAVTILKYITGENFVG